MERGHTGTNWIPILLVAALCAIGLMTLSSTDYYSGDAFHRNQMVRMLVGVMVCLAFRYIDIRLFERFALGGYVVVVLLLIGTALVGKEVYGSRRWLDLGGVVVQPSELMKVALILALARFIHRTKGAEEYTIRHLLKPFALILLPCALVVNQPDLGTTLILVFISGSMLFFEGIRFQSVLLLLALAGLIVPMAWQFDMIEEYQKDRVILWIQGDELDASDPEQKRILDKNLQTEQALWAIGSGKMVGKGRLEGNRSRLKYLPEIHNDFIIAIYAEEYGFLGVMGLLAIYVFLFLWILRVAKNTSQKFSAMVAIGTGAMLFWQFFVNIGMVTGLLPVVGLTLPFVSYGGSSLLTSFIALGLVLNIRSGRVKIA